MSDPGGVIRGTLDNPNFYPREASVAQVFSAVAAQAPDAVAITCGDVSLSYGALDAAADAAAHRLAALGAVAVGPVALATARSVETIILQLAVLKAGAAFAPLDPAFPADRLNALRDACAAVLAVADAPVDSTWIDARRLLDGDAPVAPVDASADGGAIAQIMFTSGSTGAPKGVRVRHRGIVRLVRAQTYARFGPGTVFLAAAPFSFDASTLELWAPLLNGGRVVLLPDRQPALETIADAIVRHRVNALWLTSGLFNLMVDFRLEALAGLDLLIAGGDTLSPAHVRRALDGLPRTRLLNGYGPTENTTFTTCFEITRDTWSGGAVPIGAPIAHTQVLLLDETMAPVSDGGEGRLWACGDGVAAGYVNRPEETALRFRPDPRDPAALMYDTGDMGRRRPDGVIEFLGRRDRQVKINGKRIELDAVETILREAPGVRDAAAVAETLDAGERILRVFIVASGATLESARAHLEAQLPDAAGAAFCVLDAMPVTPQGKLDRAALLAHSAAPAPTQEPEDAGTLETGIAALVGDVLRRPDPPRHVNFFDLGMTSLQLMRLHERLCARFGPFPMTTLFEFPRIDRLAAALAPEPAPGAGVRQPGVNLNQRAAALARARQRTKPGAA